MMTQKYTPEGMLWNEDENRECISSLKNLERAAAQQRTLEGIALSCNKNMDLTVGLCPGVRGIIPRSEALLALPDRQEKDIAIISRVGKPVCFKILGFRRDAAGEPVALLSRRAAQKECYTNYLSKLVPGDLLRARITHEEPFGAFVDVGCGIVSLLSIDCISVSRISHPSDRFSPGDYIRVVVKSVDRATGRIAVSHKELLGTWQENAALFETGQTVTGIVRSVEDYGVFVELTPNLAGLAENRPGVKVGQRATVFIKSIHPEKMKIKLVLIDSSPDFSSPPPPVYFLPEELSHIDFWRYSPPVCTKNLYSEFEAP